MSFPFAQEERLPNETTLTPESVLNRITNPDDLIPGLLYDFYYTPGYGHAKRLPRGRRTRTKDHKHKKSRRQRGRTHHRNYMSHMFAKVIEVAPQHIIVQPVDGFGYNAELDMMYERIERPREMILKHNFYYANLETLNEKMEDPDYDSVTEPYKKLIAMYSLNKSVPYGASIMENAFSEYDMM